MQDKRTQIKKIIDEVNASLSIPDPTKALSCMHDAVKVYGFSKMAKDTGISRSYLYKAFSKRGNPSFALVVKALAQLGYRITFYANSK